MNKGQHRHNESGQLMGSFRHLGMNISDFIMSMGRSTVRFVKNIPHQINNEYKRRLNELRRRPKRKTPNRVYSLVGYTTKAYVDSKYRAAKILRLVRTSLIFAIIVIIIIMMVKSVLPMLDPKNYQQIFGINEFEQLTENDPFIDHRDDDIVMFSTGDSLNTSGSDSVTEESQLTTPTTAEEVEEIG